ncbi:DUF934 domain-containing protein [Solimonas sp. SE-A11]|uniref:DUF934 domain-containing protein n=1 Tax=Solimonas sp. SE-A11 TaxID=3054954 RepID=UPI00259D0342|nr:DUF934 domain-containing protein [Solimonas sp. SE-A11]MDM4770172.1 DUF934 domain-containing protein [Solimonas sp. SE-A11]
MTHLIRDQQLVEHDFPLLADDAAPPASGKLIVSLERWRKDAAELRGPGLEVGVRIPNTVNVEDIWAEISDRPLINLEFPGFADGRAYSQARVLRDRYGYRGEVRASGGAVVRDQLHSMARCGINGFELRADQDPQVCLKAFEDFGLAYQPAADGALTVLRRRAS